MVETKEELQNIFDQWAKDYKIDFTKTIDLEELTQETYDQLQELDKKSLVWTLHGTCEDDVVSPTLQIFGDCKLLNQKSTTCGCWQTICFYIAEIPHDANESTCTQHWVRASANLVCPICNADGEEENINPDCEECEGEGYASYYFD